MPQQLQKMGWTHNKPLAMHRWLKMTPAKPARKTRTSQANDGMADGSEDVTQATSDDVVTQPASDDAKPMVGDDEAIQGKNAAVAASAAADGGRRSRCSSRCSIG